MPKLIIQIPCLNEAETLSATVAALPRELPGIDAIEYLVVDDGSTDGTAEVARRSGVHHIVRFPQNQGLAKAFSAGMDAALKLGADVIVNTDADNQYDARDLPALIKPILDGNADMVIGDRGPGTLAHFSPMKRALQFYGSWVVRGLSGTTVPDAASGFRAFSRRAALRLNVISEFTYTLETLVQAGKKQLAVTHVPVRTNSTRPSRLFSSIPNYLRRSFLTLVRIYSLYEPIRVFWSIGTVMVAAGFAIGLRFLYYYLTIGAQGKIQSLILSAALSIIGVQTILMGLIADLIGSSRSLVEDTLLRVRKIELRLGEGADIEPGLHEDPEDAPEALGEVRRRGAGPR
ncbi:MAG TPA: glycosyltransferase family 2 protein [Candidatus Bathyarchaeia archaeon]|nr:glycosyltransferase family 2 protein [Candidatus Bathyarchaeia archaeon]